MRRRVLLDCDGVLADFVGGFLRIVNARFGTSIAREHIVEYDIGASLGWSREVTDEAYRLISAAPRFAADLDAHPGAVEGVRRLSEIADVYIVTSPWWSSPTWMFDRTNWLMDRFGIPAARVVHTAAKDLIVGDVLVDDKTSTCESWRAAHPIGVAVQWVTPHNRRDTWSGVSASTWDDVIDIIARLPR